MTTTEIKDKAIAIINGCYTEPMLDIACNFVNLMYKSTPLSPVEVYEVAQAIEDAANRLKATANQKYQHYIGQAMSGKILYGQKPQPETLHNIFTNPGPDASIEVLANTAP